MAEKKIIIYEDDAQHGRFRIQLKYDDMSQPGFFKMMIDSYVDRDPQLMEFIFKKLEQKKSKHRKKTIKKQEKIERKIEEDFALNEDEIKNIFDLIASEDPDL